MEYNDPPMDILPKKKPFRFDLNFRDKLKEQ